MFLKKIFVFVLSLVIVCESALVDTLHKCGIKDGECQRKQIADVMAYAVPNGIPELKFPVLDPLKLENVKVTILDVQFKFDGVVRGVKDCEITKYLPNFDKGATTLEIKCAIIVLEGKYEVTSSSELVKSLAGGQIHGNGIGKVECKNVKLEIKIPFAVVKKEDGIFLTSKRNKLTYTFEVDNVRFEADNLYIGDKESSETLIPLINQSSDALVKTVGKLIMDIVMDYVFNLATLFTSNVSAEHYFIEDLTPYVKS